MRTPIKIVLIIVVFMLTVPLLALTQGNPMLKVIVIAGLFGAIRAIWKYNPQKDTPDTDDDDHQLDKS